MTCGRLSVGVLGLASVLVALAQPQSAYARSSWDSVAPTPRSAPRTPVKNETLPGSKTNALPASRILEGKAQILDAERLKIENVEMRLFGVVPPQLSASFGPQARTVVDALAQGDVTCHVRDRDRDGRYLATCKSASNVDFGLELLRRGLAVSARGTLRSSDVAASYIAAEQAAQAQRLGIWSSTLPAAASESAIREAAAKAEAAKQEAERAKQEAEKAETAKAEVAAAEQESALKTADSLSLPSAAIMAEPSAVSSKNPPLPPLKPETNAIDLGPTAAEVQAMLSAPVPDAAEEVQSVPERGIVERYQALIAGLLILLTGLVVGGSFVVRAMLAQRNSLRALAAALRGELMAARSVCMARLAKMTHDPDEKTVTWPRLRALVFQAHVGRLGELGADLSRQIASIYGQASDYASYYAGSDARGDLAAKKHSLQTLVQHIEEVVPRLGQVEQEGRVLGAKRIGLSPLLLTRATRSTPALPSDHTSPPSGGPGHPAPLPSPDDSEKASNPKVQASEALAEAKAEIVSEDEAEPVRAASSSKAVSKEEILKNAQAIMEPVSSGKDEAFHEAVADEKTEEEPTAAAEANAEDSTGKINFKAPIFERLARIGARMSAQMDKLRPRPMDGMMPDYAQLTEEELEALAYAEEYLSGGQPDRFRKAG